MNRFWPRYTPSLPMPHAREDDVSVGYSIKFILVQYGKVAALIYDDFGDLVDQLIGSDFRDAYDQAREAYPQAEWNNNAR